MSTSRSIHLPILYCHADFEEYQGGWNPTTPAHQASNPETTPDTKTKRTIVLNNQWCHVQLQLFEGGVVQYSLHDRNSGVNCKRCGTSNPFHEKKVQPKIKSGPSAELDTLPQPPALVPLQGLEQAPPTHDVPKVGNSILVTRKPIPAGTTLSRFQSRASLSGPERHVRFNDPPSEAFAELKVHQSSVDALMQDRTTSKPRPSKKKNVKPSISKASLSRPVPTLSTPTYTNVWTFVAANAAEGRPTRQNIKRFSLYGEQKLDMPERVNANPQSGFSLDKERRNVKQWMTLLDVLFHRCEPFQPYAAFVEEYCRNFEVEKDLFLDHISIEELILVEKWKSSSPPKYFEFNPLNHFDTHTTLRKVLDDFYPGSKQVFLILRFHHPRRYSSDDWDMENAAENREKSPESKTSANSLLPTPHTNSSSLPCAVISSPPREIIDITDEWPQSEPELLGVPPAPTLPAFSAPSGEVSVPQMSTHQSAPSMPSVRAIRCLHPSLERFNLGGTVDEQCDYFRKWIYHQDSKRDKVNDMFLVFLRRWLEAELAKMEAAEKIKWLEEEAGQLRDQVKDLRQEVHNFEEANRLEIEMEIAVERRQKELALQSAASALVESGPSTPPKSASLFYRPSVSPMSPDTAVKSSDTINLPIGTPRSGNKRSHTSIRTPEMKQSGFNPQTTDRDPSKVSPATKRPCNPPESPSSK